MTNAGFRGFLNQDKAKQQAVHRRMRSIAKVHKVSLFFFAPGQVNFDIREGMLYITVVNRVR